MTSGALVVGQVAPAFAQVVPERTDASDVTTGTTQTLVTSTGADTFDITTGTVENASGQDVGYNVFSQFDIANGTAYDLIQPSGSDALVNIVRGNTSASTIAGTLNINHADAGTTSNVFIVDSNGFVVSGTVNAGNLTLSTATSDFADDLVDGMATGGSVAELFAGDEPLAASSITITGAINAAGLEMRSGLDLILDGTITVTDPNPVAGSPGVAVNTEGRPQATGATVSNGVIRLEPQAALKLVGPSGLRMVQVAVLWLWPLAVTCA